MCSRADWVSFMRVCWSEAACDSMSLENHSLNSSCESKRPGHDEVQKSPQFLHCIRNRRSGEQQTVSAVDSQQCFPAIAAGAFDCLCFVQNHVLPFNALEMPFHQPLAIGSSYPECGMVHLLDPKA